MKDGKDIGTSSQTYNRNVGELLEELMGVSLRPIEIERMIKQFRNYVAHNKKANAEDLYEELKKYLSLEDPFHITAKMCLDRMK